MGLTGVPLSPHAPTHRARLSLQSLSGTRTSSTTNRPVLKTIPPMFGVIGALLSCLITRLEDLSPLLPDSITTFIISQEASAASTYQNQPSPRIRRLTLYIRCTGTPMNSGSTIRLSTCSTAPSTPWKCRFSQTTFTRIPYSARRTLAQSASSSNLMTPQTIPGSTGKQMQQQGCQSLLT